MSHPTVDYSHTIFVPSDESIDQTLLNTTLDPSGIRFLLKEAGFKDSSECAAVTGVPGIPRHIHVQVWIDDIKE